MAVCVVLLARFATGAGQPPGRPAPSQADLTGLSLEDLLSIEVISVSRKKQRVSETASAVYVITQEDILRSGASSIPEALRLAPGVHVARVDANKWAVSIRGFNDRFSDKLLVMIDGRTVYTPLFSGVYWETQDTFLEDIERIEVVRGPGGVMWGSNAVNGVINIITKSARDTQGGAATAGGGNQKGSLGEIRYGGASGPRLHYRVYSKYFKRRAQLTSDGDRAGDERDVLRGGFRGDWEYAGHGDLMLSGEAYDGRTHSRLSIPSAEFPYQELTRDETSLSGGNVLGRWTKRLGGGGGSSLALQMYLDRNSRSGRFLEENSLTTFDADFQHELAVSSGQRLLWGLGHRVQRDELITLEQTFFDPNQRTTRISDVLVRDEIRPWGDSLVLTLGARFEHNSFTGWETQPAASLLWDRGPDSLWVSTARAVRIPSRVNHDVRTNIRGFAAEDGRRGLLSLFGSPEFRAEELWAYDAGYRGQACKRVSLDFAAFYNRYDELQTTVQGEPFIDPELPSQPLVIPLFFRNGGEGKIYGAEAAAAWPVSGKVRLSTSYSWLVSRTRVADPAPRISLGDANGRSPKHQVHARLYVDLPAFVKFDTAYYFVDTLPSVRVPSYHRFDFRIAWLSGGPFDFSAGLRNALDNQHPESVPLGFELPSEAGRSLYGKVRWRF